MGSELGRKGTPVWAFKRYSEGLLPRLLDDLIAAEKKGVTDEECGAIHQSLQNGAALAAAIPDGPCFSIRAVAERLVKRHSTWNEVKGCDDSAVEERRACMVKLRRTRHSIARRLRKNGHWINKNLDLKRFREVHGALSKLVEDSPDTFPKLARALGKISGRLASHGLI